MASSGKNQDTPKLSPVQPAPARAANKAPALRMAGYRPPGQLQFHPRPQRRQGIQPPGDRAGRFSTMGTTTPGSLKIRPVRVLPATPTMDQCFHTILLLTCTLGAGVGH